jgi:hypothetical protein
VPHAAGAGVDQHRLARLYARPIVEGLPRREADQRQAGRGQVLDRRRFPRGGARVEEHVVGVGAGAEQVRGAEDEIPGAPALDLGPTAANHPAGVVTENDGHRARGAAAAPNLDVDGIDRGGVHLDEELMSARRRHRQLLGMKHVRASMLSQDDRAHAGSLAADEPGPKPRRDRAPQLASLADGRRVSL